MNAISATIVTAFTVVVVTAVILHNKRHPRELLSPHGVQLKQRTVVQSEAFTDWLLVTAVGTAVCVIADVGESYVIALLGSMTAGILCYWVRAIKERL